MKILKALSVSFLLGMATLNSTVFANNTVVSVNFSEIPVKTVCIKHAAASNADNFFAQATFLSFEVYKPGSKEELANIISSLKKANGVESVTEGKLNGDYQAITITLKSTKNKAWFASEFKKAGLNTVRINNNPIVEVDKM